MRKSVFILAMAIIALIKTTNAQYTGTEWEVNNYQSIFGKNVLVKIELSQVKNVFILNEKGKPVPIAENEMDYFFSGNPIFSCKGIDTIKRKRYIKLETNEKTYFLFINPKEESEYLKSIRNLSVYDNLVSQCNKNYGYIKTIAAKITRRNDIESAYIDFNDLTEYADTSYKIKWTGFDCSFPNKYAKIKGLLLGKTKNYEIAISLNKLEQSDFFTEHQISEIYLEKERLRKIEEEMNAKQHRLDAIEDTKYHAYVLLWDLANQHLDKGDTIFMFSRDMGWHGGEMVYIDVPNVLQEVSVANGTKMLYSVYESYIKRRNGEGEEYRSELARKRDSISVMGRLERLMNYLEEVKSYYDELDKKQIFLTGKEYAYGDYSDFGLQLEFYNCFKKTIKYIKFETKSYNKFGDSQGDYFGKKVSGGTCVGPLESGESAKWRFDDLYYDKNDMIEYVCVTKVTFTFLDNSTLTFTDINNHKTKDVYNTNK